MQSILPCKVTRFSTWATWAAHVTPVASDQEPGSPRGTAHVDASEGFWRDMEAAVNETFQTAVKEGPSIDDESGDHHPTWGDDGRQ